MTIKIQEHEMAKQLIATYKLPVLLQTAGEIRKHLDTRQVTRLFATANLGGKLIFIFLGNDMVFTQRLSADNSINILISSTAANASFQWARMDITWEEYFRGMEAAGYSRARVARREFEAYEVATSEERRKQRRYQEYLVLKAEFQPEFEPEEEAK